MRTRIELRHNQDLHPAGILKTLKGEGLVVSLSGITRMIKKLRLTGSVANLPRSGRPRKLSVEARAFIDQQMHKNDEMTSAKIQKKLAKRGICVSSSTVRRSRKQQGWTLQRTAYCPLIRDANKVKQLEFAQCVLESGDTFHNTFLVMSAQFRSSHIAVNASRWRMSPPSESRNRSTCSKFMSGGGD